MEFRELIIRGVGRATETGAPIVVLQNPEADRRLALNLTADVAHRIASEVDGCGCARASIYAVIAYLVSSQGFVVRSVVLHAWTRDRLMAAARVQDASDETPVVCHRLDALAPGHPAPGPDLRHPRFLQGLAENAVALQAEPLPDEGEATAWLDGFRPEDFGV